MGALLTVKEVAARLKVSTRTVQRWQEEGTIAFIKLPQGVRFREEFLENWIDKRTIKAHKKAS
jgi:excisionase family DNA binding protein